MATSDILSIGLSGAKAAKHALTTAGHNIANANTKGYSRQRIQTDTRQAQTSGVGALGTGVKVTNVKRLHDSFVIEEVRSNASIANSLKTNYEFTSQIDNMLSDPNAGLAPVLHSFFAAINNVANNPSSKSSRQVLIGEANSLSERFSYLDQRFESLRKGTNETLKSHVGDVNNLAKAIANINWKIVLTKEVVQGEPNDLLDQRDRLLHQLSEKITVTTNEQEDGSLNVFIGNGQTLVLGKNTSSLSLQLNQHDPSKLEIVYNSLGANAIVTQFLKGGSIGGLLDFRDGMLNDAQNELGRIALGVTKSFNDQHHKGMTLNNKLGGYFFSAIDQKTPITLPSNENQGDLILKTIITKTDNLTVSDYHLNYNNGMYTLIRDKDDSIVSTFSSLPQEIESEGFRIEVLRGTIIENGDSYSIQPTRAAARSFAVAIESTDDIAAAAPIRMRKSVHNIGTAKLTLTNVSNINAPSFTTLNGTLSPSITVRFIDEHHIELLDDKGNVIQARQMESQNKTIPATPAIPGALGSPATPAISASPSFANNSVASSPENEQSVSSLESGILYDADVGINLFPTPLGMDTGYSVQISGHAKAGDVFVIEYNTDAVGSNINALELGALQSKGTLDNGTSSYNEVYSQLVSRVGSKTHELDVNREAQGVLYEQSKAQRQSISGVNLDEEAADLIRYQQAYTANAKVIAAASAMFDTLISVLKR